MPARVSTKGQLVLPARIRKKYGIDPGKEVEILDFGGEIVIVAVPEGRGRGLLRFDGYPAQLVREARRRAYELRA